MNGAAQSNCWSEMLSDDWAERRRITNWKGLPQVHHYCNALMGAAPNMDWIDYARDNHLAPLARGKGLSLVSFGCGTGEIEHAFIKRGWPISRVVLREYDAALLKNAEGLLQDLNLDKSFEFFDFNNPVRAPDETYDVAFFCHSIHHVQNLETFLPYLNSLLREDSIILGLDHFGPTRMQTEYNVRELLERIFKILPPRLRRNLVKEGLIEDRFPGFNMSELIRNDPTEAPRSSDLRTLLFSLFEIVEIAPMGGTLLAPLLAFRAGNYTSEDDFAILGLLMLLEEQLIKARGIDSDDLFFVLRRSDRFQVI